MVWSRIYTTEAVILKRRNIGEADRLITVFTKQHGKLRLIAKGIRKITSRRGPHLEVFSHIRLTIHHGKTFDSISEVQTVDAFANIRKKLSRISRGYYICELVDGLLAEKQEHRDVFELVVRIFTSLNNSDSQSTINVQTIEFTLELLRRLGFLSESKHLSPDELTSFVESIIEKRLRTPKFMHQVG